MNEDELIQTMFERGYDSISWEDKVKLNPNQYIEIALENNRRYYFKRRKVEDGN